MSEEQPQEPQKPRVVDVLRMWHPGEIQLYTKRMATWFGEVGLTTEIHEPMLRARTPFQENDEIVPNWQGLTSGDWVAIKQLKTQLYERRGE